MTGHSSGGDDIVDEYRDRLRCLAGGAYTNTGNPTASSLELMATNRTEAVGLPVVGIGTTGETSQAISVFIDNVVATRRVTRHLLSLGHRDFGLSWGAPSS